MLNRPEQSALNLEEARALRAAGKSYREIRRLLALTVHKLSHIRRALKREKAARTRLRTAMPQAQDRDLPISQSVLPPGLRKILAASGYRTLGDLADRHAEDGCRGLETLSGVGPYRARLILNLLNCFGLLSGPSDLQAAVELHFPELRDPGGEGA